MPPALKDSKGLNPQQRAAARHEAAGNMKLSEIAEAVGVDNTSISAWRRMPEYIEYREHLAAQMDADAIADAAEVRRSSLEVVRTAVAMVQQRLDAVEDPADEDLDTLVRAAKFAHDVYKTTSAQTGVVETSRTEVVDPAALVAKMRSELDDASEEELERLADGD